MKTYSCQVLRPKKSALFNVRARSVAEAAGEMQFKTHIYLKSDLPGHPCFSVVAVNEEVVLSRVFFEGIGRSGGVKPSYPSIETIARELDFDVADFTGEFEGEEETGKPIDECGSSATPAF